MQSKPVYEVTKRLLDLLLAGTALIVLLPVIAIVAVLVRLRMGSPVIFNHPRPGKNEVVFPCLKFRSMTNERDANGDLLPDMERLTAFGKFLRRSSLDELPQLWSVVKGDMSLVGPRPLEIRYLDRYTSEQRRRQNVMPGITGWSQVNGRNAIDWDRKLELDIWYVDNRSLLLDIQILFLTVAKVINADGVARAGQVSMDEFYGTAAPGPQHITK
jgi:sugar transferase EpsL